MDWIYSGLFFFALFIVILIAEGLRKLLKWSSNTTRKIVHITTGVFVASTPLLLNSKIPIIIISAIFTIINFFAIRLGFFPGMHATSRRSYGTVFYPLALVILLIFFWGENQLILVISMLVLAFADPLAALTGEKLTHLKQYQLARDKKTLAGSVVMFLTTVIIVFWGLKFGIYYFAGNWEITTLQVVWMALVVGIIATVCEALSAYGSDNLSIPLGTAFILHFMLTRLNTPAASENIQLTLGLVLAALVAATTYYFRFLNSSGAVGTFLLGTVVFGIGGWKFSLPILAFFILSSLLSKVGKTRKKKLAQTFQKSSQRDIGQVLANGGLAGVLVLIWNYYPRDLLFYLYLGALSAVTADTWATEIGFFAKKLPRLILNWKPVPQGTSGGITFLGTSAAVLGSSTIAYAGWVSNSNYLMTLNIGISIISAGLLACMFDSLLGATIQAQYQCPHCQKITEKKSHCNNIQTRQISGLSWIDNDLVNFLASVFGALVVWFEIMLFSL